MVEAGEVELFDGALELFELLASSGRTSYLATGASRRSTDQVLHTTGLDRYLKGTVTADDVTRGKPDPESFAMIVRRWQLQPAECLVVEDAENGVAAAHAAGIDAVVVHSPEVTADLNLPTLAALKKLLEGQP
jgi:beta-phosphoglucomutase-like phosphatase (HAD superfamily)